MRSCRQCGVQFGLYRHFVLRSEFCKKECFEAFQVESARLARVRQANKDKRELEESERGPGRLVDHLQEGVADPSLYFLGADFAEYRLAQLMGPGIATFGVKARWPVTSGRPGPWPTLEQISAPYAAAIAANAPPAGCVLAGYSFSGLIAYEAARKLLAQGVNVEAVILIDCRPRRLRSLRVLREKLRAIWRKPLGTGLLDRMSSMVSRGLNSWLAFQWALAREARQVARQYSRAILRDPGPISELIDEHGERMYWGFLEKVIINAENSYELGRVDCKGILICVDEDRDGQARELDPSLGWGNLFERGLEIVNLPGSHITIMLTEPYSTTLARTLKKLMLEFRARRTERIPSQVREGSQVA